MRGRGSLAHEQGDNFIYSTICQNNYSLKYKDFCQKQCYIFIKCQVLIIKHVIFYKNTATFL